jgi:cyanophycinase
MRRTAGLLLLSLLLPATTLAQGSAVKVGPQRGTVIVVGGGSMGPELYSAFIQAAGGPDALIIDVPTAGGDSIYTQEAAGTRGWRQAGAKNIYVYHTRNRRLADSDSFTAILKKARGIWFEGGRQFHLMDAYAGTKTEQAFRDLLARGGVVGGSSAGATILGDFLVRGAPSSNNMIMYYPGNEKAWLPRRVAIDQHVVARERLPDLADSIMPRFPELLGISEDEGTAWVVKGDTGTIIGKSKAFVYGGKDKNDPGRPFLTLYPGDKYNLATRRVLHRAADESPVRSTFVDSLFSKFNDPGTGGATVLIARGGKVFVARSYGIPEQPRYMPTTTVPQFALGDLGMVFTEICAQLPEQPGRGGANADSTGGAGRGGRGGANAGTPLQNCARRVGQPLGMHKTNASSVGQVLSNVDELYRLFLGLENPRTFSRDTAGTFDATRGWRADTYAGAARLNAYWNTDGKRHAFVRIPSQRATVIILTNDDAFDAKAAADAIVEKLIQK